MTSEQTTPSPKNSSFGGVGAASVTSSIGATVVSPLEKIPFISKVLCFACTSVKCPFYFSNVSSSWDEAVHEYPRVSAENVWRCEEATLRREPRLHDNHNNRRKHVDPYSNQGESIHSDDEVQQPPTPSPDVSDVGSDCSYSPLVPGVTDNSIHSKGPNIKNVSRRAALALLKHACSSPHLIRVVDSLFKAKVVSIYSSFEILNHINNNNHSALGSEWQSHNTDHNSLQAHTPLTLAACHGLHDHCQLLINSFEADPMRPSSASNSSKALHYACQSGDLQTVQFLYERTKKGYDELFADKALTPSNFYEGNFINGHVPLGTALTRAIASKSLPVVEFLLKKVEKGGAGASPVWPNQDRWSPMDVAVLFEDPEDFVVSLEMVKLLYKAGAPLCQSAARDNFNNKINNNTSSNNKKKNDDNTTYAELVNDDDNDNDVDHDIVGSGAEFNQQQQKSGNNNSNNSNRKKKKRRSPHRHGVPLPEDPTVDEGFPSSSDDDSDSEGNNHSDDEDNNNSTDGNDNDDDNDEGYNQDDEDERLIQMHISPEEHMSPLLLAAEVGNLKLIDWLLQTGADPTAKNGMGQTCLHISNLKRHDDCVKYLVQSGCVDIYAKDLAGDDAFSAARKRQHLEMVSHFKDHAFQFVNHAMQSTANQQRQQQQLTQDLQNNDGSLSNDGFSFDRDQLGNLVTEINTNNHSDEDATAAASSGEGEGQGEGEEHSNITGDGNADDYYDHRHQNNGVSSSSSHQQQQHIESSSSDDHDEERQGYHLYSRNEGDDDEIDQQNNGINIDDDDEDDQDLIVQRQRSLDVSDL